MNTQPQVVKCRDFITRAGSYRQFKDGSWGPSRYLPFYYGGLYNLLNRIKCAWLVFTGKCDALDWEDDK